MALRARLDPTADAWSRDRVRVLVDDPATRLVWRQARGEDGRLEESWHPVEDPAVLPDGDLLAIDLPDFIARVVYDALRDRYEPELADARRLDRRDLDVERYRVDRLLEVVSRVALDGVTAVLP